MKQRINLRNGLWLELVEPNHYVTFGQMETCHIEYDSVVVDGETYRKQRLVTDVMCLKTQYERGKMTTNTTEFMRLFGKPEIKISYYEFKYSTSLSKGIGYEYSTNNYAYFLCVLDELKLLPKFIKLNKGKDYDFKPNWLLYEITIYELGWNNKIKLEIGYQDILKYKIPKELIYTSLNGKEKDQFIPEDYKNIDRVNLLAKYINNLECLSVK